mmetsp:Transcript_27665/g.65802  ORF Transcript_27665/g.65802 Transcript_27665/m.65802 type:complete len:346 (-) Transcript_27665:2131-3168(-)
MPTLSRIIRGALLAAIAFVLFGLFGHFQIHATLDRTQIHNDRPGPIDPASKREEVRLDRLPFLRELRDRGLDLSRRQQQRFFSVKDLIIPQVIRNPRYRHLYRDDERNGRYFAYILNERFAFRHIFKNGGSAVEAQINRKQVNRRDIGSRRLVAVVRDPVEHFLSGWAECGSRNNLAETKPKKFDGKTYDTRIKRWLSVVMKPVDFNTIPSHQKRFYRCRAHSFPQANFLLLPLHDSQTNTRGNGTFPQLDLVGDLRELPAVLTLTGFRWSMTMGRESNRTNVAEDNADKQLLYPKRVDLLANGTLKLLCSFLSLDYYLFAFDPPPVCRDNLTLPLLNNLVAETF